VKCLCNYCLQVLIIGTFLDQIWIIDVCSCCIGKTFSILIPHANRGAAHRAKMGPQHFPLTFYPSSLPLLFLPQGRQAAPPRKGQRDFTADYRSTGVQQAQRSSIL